jgi:16S rRNA (guanine(527)-N(7))-methyltransferase RsmG
VSPVFAELLRKGLAEVAELSSAQLSPAQFAVLEAHYNLTVRWNKILNLTKITALAEAVERHYVESLFLGVHLPPESLRIADIGSGAGFPGFPVAVLRQDCEVTLIESHQRKAVFLREASRDLQNVRVVGKRTEEVTDVFDWVVSRAVSYEDLAKSIHSMARNVALLTGDEEPPEVWGWQWAAPIVVPSGKARFLRLGKLKS